MGTGRIRVGTTAILTASLVSMAPVNVRATTTNGADRADARFMARSAGGCKVGMSLSEMEMLPEKKSPGRITVTQVCIVEDEETGIVTRQPIHFCLGATGTLEAAVRRIDPDFHLGAVCD